MSRGNRFRTLSFHLVGNLVGDRLQRLLIQCHPLVTSKPALDREDPIAESEGAHQGNEDAQRPDEKVAFCGERRMGDGRAWRALGLRQHGGRHSD